MKKIKINVADFEYGSNPNNNFLIQILQNKYDIEFSDTPDFLIYSVWGHEHKKYDCVKIFYTGEPASPNFNECDYAIGFDNILFDDRYIRLPLFAMQITKDIQNRDEFKDISFKNKKFCNFIYNNESIGEGAKIRKEFCQRLMKYQKIDCPGTVLHNMESNILSDRFDKNWYQSKIDFIKDYKFTIAFENTFINGYTTEKLTQPFIAGSIPIYFGNAKVAKDFNAKAFINAADYENDFDAVIEKVIELDRDAQKAKKMILQPPLKDNHWFRWKEDLDFFLENIIEKGNKPFEKFKEKDVDKDGGINQTVNFRIYGAAILDEIKKYKKVYIFGNGLFGRKIGKLLIENFKVDITGFAVTKTRDFDDKLMGKPIMAIKDIFAGENALLLIAVREETQPELIMELNKMGWNNIISVNPFLIKVLQSILP